MRFSYRWLVVGTLLTLIGGGVTMEEVTTAVYILSLIIGVGCAVDMGFTVGSKQ